MSTVDMIILGLLIDHPMNAYEMKKVLEYRNVKAWTKLSIPAMYKNLIKLNEAGYIDGKIVREGSMPEKTVYTINKKGKEYFMKIMKNCSAHPSDAYVEFASFILNLNVVDKDMGMEMLEKLQQNMHVKLEHIKDQKRQKEQTQEVPKSAIAIIELYIRMYEVFDQWFDEFRPIYKDSDSAK